MINRLCSYQFRQITGSFTCTGSDTVVLNLLLFFYFIIIIIFFFTKREALTFIGEQFFLKYLLTCYEVQKFSEFLTMWFIY